MGYTIKIGNAVPKISKESFPELEAYWEVEQIELKEAPSFPNDARHHRNCRYPSYSVWHYFCESVGLYEFFYYPHGDLRAGHPGIIGITQEDVGLVSYKLAQYQLCAKLPPGFEENGFDGRHQLPTYDYNLARLIWLEWWMRWAVNNCETPAIQNS